METDYPEKHMKEAIERLIVALKHRRDLENKLREQMKAETAKMRLTTYGRLPAWPEYEHAKIAVAEAEDNLLEANLKKAMGEVRLTLGVKPKCQT